MKSPLLVLLFSLPLFLLPLLLESIHNGVPKNTSFYENYFITWGSDHLASMNHGQKVQLSLDPSSGYTSPFFYDVLFVGIWILIWSLTVDIRVGIRIENEVPEWFLYHDNETSPTRLCRSHNGFLRDCSILFFIDYHCFVFLLYVYIYYIWYAAYF